MLRFAILTHDYPHLHWDLLVEHSPEEKLWAWRLEQPPRERADISAEALPEHRRLYLDYEGPVSGDRGEVKRWDGGEVVILSQTATEITLQMKGEQLQGTAELKHIKENLWRFRYDPFRCDSPERSKA